MGNADWVSIASQREKDQDRAKKAPHSTNMGKHGKSLHARIMLTSSLDHNSLGSAGSLHDFPFVQNFRANGDLRHHLA